MITRGIGDKDQLVTPTNNWNNIRKRKTKMQKPENDNSAGDNNYVNTKNGDNKSWTTGQSAWSRGHQSQGNLGECDPVHKVIKSPKLWPYISTASYIINNDGQDLFIFRKTIKPTAFPAQRPHLVWTTWRSCWNKLQVADKSYLKYHNCTTQNRSKTPRRT